MICGYGCWSVFLASICVELVLLLSFVDFNFTYVKEGMGFKWNSTISLFAQDASVKDNFNAITNIKKFENTEKPVILLWTKYYTKNHTGFDSMNCNNKCIITTDRRAYDGANVVVYHGSDVDTSDMPPRGSNKSNLFWMRESPGRNPKLYFYKSWKSVAMSFFNCTMTYKSNSDYVFNYFEFRKRSSKIKSLMNKKIDLSMKNRNSSLPVFALISHCNAESHRDELINEVSKYIDVDRYGRCPGYMPWNANPDLLFEKYYFYLALENSICDEYVTEKLARMKHMIVPVTISRGAVPRYVPPDSYIAMDDFCSVQELAEHLQYLTQNQTAYRKYLEWHTEYSLQPATYSHFCEICDDLRNGKVKTTDYSKYATISDYMSRKECHNDLSLTIMENKTCK